MLWYRGTGLSSWGTEEQASHVVVQRNGPLMVWHRETGLFCCGTGEGVSHGVVQGRGLSCCGTWKGPLIVF